MDRILKTLIYNNEISLSVIDITNMINEAIKIHSLSPLTAAAVGRTLAAATYMCSTLKDDDDRLSVSINGDGVGGSMSVSGDSHLNMRCCIDNPLATLKPNALGKLDVAGCVGKGTMTVIKSMGLKTPFVGTVELVSGEIAEDFANYFLVSEQLPTALALGVKIGVLNNCLAGGGVVICPLPNCSEESLAKAEAVLPKLKNISTLLEEYSLEEIVKNLFGDYKLNIFYPKYKCICSRDYIKGLLITIGETELYDIINSEGKVSLHCHYCNKDYDFYREDIDEILRISNEK